jgi:cystathionine beta-lyase
MPEEKRRTADATRIIRSGRRPGDAIRTVGPPIEKGSTILTTSAAALYDDSVVTYGRSGLSVQADLCAALCELEGASQVCLFPSGLAALSGTMLAILTAGDHLLVSDAVYSPTRRFCERVLRRFGVEVSYYAPRTAPDDLLAMSEPATRMILLESPGSLTFEMQGAPGIAKLFRERGVLTLMDNTWAAGLHFKPLAHEIDLSIQALTKFVGGHSDVFMGSAATRRPELARALAEAVRDVGWSVAPEDAYQIIRGLRTLPTRMARHETSGLAVASWLREHPHVLDVLYPALPGAADHDLWRRDYSGAPGLFSVVLEAGSSRAVEGFLDSLELFGLGFSWGGFESLALNCDPQFTSRVQTPGFAGPAIRLHIGLEDPLDLIEDLKRGFAAFGRSLKA